MVKTSKLFEAKYELLPNIKKPKNSILHIFLKTLGIILLLVIIYLSYDIYNANKHLVKAEKEDVSSHYWTRRGLIYAKSFNLTNYENNKTDYIETKIENDDNYRNNNDEETYSYKLVCYLIFPSDITEQNNHEFIHNKLNSELCTHINVGFVNIVNCSVNINESEGKILKSIAGLKTKKSNLKVLFSVGGAYNDAGFSEMVENHKNRKIFIKSIVNTLHEYNLDGVDLDWEFPNTKHSNDSKQRQHFTQLLHELRSEINRQSDDHKFILSVAVAAPQTIVDIAYDVDYINDNVDYINLMSYDFHVFSKFTPWTGLNAPLYKKTSEVGLFSAMNINASAYHWVLKGMDKSKIVVGLPTYGHSFTLVNSDNNGIQAPAKGNGNTGIYGFITHLDACKFTEQDGTFIVFDKEAKSLYAVNNDQWISYDDVQTLSYKTDFVKTNNFAGAMVFSLNSDNYYKGFCGSNYGKNESKQDFPLTHIIRYTLFDDSL